MIDVIFVEWAIVLTVVYFQLSAIIQSLSLSNLYRNIFSEVDSVKCMNVKILKEDIEKHTPRELIRIFGVRRVPTDLPPEEIKITYDELLQQGYSESEAKVKAETIIWNKIHKGKARIEAMLIQTSEELDNAVFKKILSDINLYLFRNRAVTPDYSLIENVINHHCNSIDDQINLLLPQPLYLGLLGTMAGVIAGLFNISTIGGRIDPSTIMTLLGGVKIAMFASGMGLLGTIITASGSYRKSKRILEEQKNAFLIFIQTELLPITNRDINANFMNLQTNLVKFNEDFSNNVTKTNEMMKSHDHIAQMQLQMLTKLEAIDIAAVATINQKTFYELNLVLPQLSQLSQYLKEVNEFISTSRELSSRLLNILNRTEKVGNLGEEVKSQLETNGKLMEFLRSHFQDLENRKADIARAITNVDDILQKSLEELQKDVQEKLIAIRKIAIKEEDLLLTVRSESATNFGKLKYLEKIHEIFVHNDINGNINGMRDDIKELTSRMVELTGYIKSVNKDSFWNNTYKSIKRSFSRNN